MARNVEKSQNVLNRLLNAKNAEARPGGKPARRPFLASECDDLADADRWRAQVVREIGSKVMEIQNAGLGESRLRDLNDEINKLLREKGHWERRIVELGGPDYSKTAPDAGGAAGGVSASSSASARGAYRYFGAAKLLPGVKELFEAPPVRGSGGGGRATTRRPQLVPGTGRGLLWLPRRGRGARAAQRRSRGGRSEGREAAGRVGEGARGSRRRGEAGRRRRCRGERRRRKLLRRRRRRRGRARRPGQGPRRHRGPQPP